MARLVSYKVKDDSTYFTFENKSASVADRLMTITEENCCEELEKSSNDWKCSLWRCCWCCTTSDDSDNQLVKRNDETDTDARLSLVKYQHDQVIAHPPGTTFVPYFWDT